MSQNEPKSSAGLGGAGAGQVSAAAAGLPLMSPVLKSTEQRAPTILRRPLLPQPGTQPCPGRTVETSPPVLSTT